jgi:pyruvate kinase
MSLMHIHRRRNVKIVATLGPSTTSYEEIRAVFEAGADVFRLNFSHGEHADHAARMKIIRQIEKEAHRPIGVMADMQGPKLRMGRFKGGKATLKAGQAFRLDLEENNEGDKTRAPLPHKEIFQALEPGAEVLMDDGRIRMEVVSLKPDSAEMKVTAGGVLSDRKGVNLPGVLLPVSPLTKKDRIDLEYAISIGADWIALSFVQRPDDLAEARALIKGRAGLLTKFEKPAAIKQMDQLVELSDAVMVARGDLGVETPPEDVPLAQKQLIRACRLQGKPVIVATQMLESMVTAPAPTRAEASDVATAVFDGADAVMLSAETAAGQYPVEAVSMMDRIAVRTESDPGYRDALNATRHDPDPTAADALSRAARQVAETISAAAIVTYTTSGSTTLRASRERAEAPVLGLTSRVETARQLALAWGVRPEHTADVTDFSEMVRKACAIAYDRDLAKLGDRIVVTAGVPFGTPGSTNVLRIAWITGDEA